MTRCIGLRPDGSRCRRDRREPVGGGVHAHCDSCEKRLLREAFGPVSWHDRAQTNTLPPLVVGGVPIDSRHPDSAPSAGREGTPRSSASRARRVAALATQPA